MDDLTVPAGVPGEAASLRALMAELIPALEVARPGAPPLEVLSGMDESVQLVGCEQLESDRITAIMVGNPAPRFRAFLDGRQKSDPLGFVRGVPLILGSVAAVIRYRDSARATTWRLARDAKLYAPLSQIGSIPTQIQSRIAIVDTDTEGESVTGNPTSMRHPLELNRRTYHLIQRDREKLEQNLAEQWCAASEDEPLLVDGSIPRVQARNDCVVGLVKSHRTMYVRDDEMDCVLNLQEGERSSAFRIESRNGPVASWYLRMRREAGFDALWGLVRVEIPIATHTKDRADEVSRWILAERSPISLPDPRWDRLIYGVRDCEMFLSAVM